MEPFTLQLHAARQVTGLTSFPPPQQRRPAKAVPLLVCIHGGTYAANYFDADANYTIRKISVALAIPVIAINRPGYRDSTPLPDPTNKGDDTWIQQQGKDLHTTILPALWNRYSRQTAATSIVLLGHSIGMMTTIVAASLHARSQAVYPLSGIAMSGAGGRTKFASVGLQPRELDEHGQRPRSTIWTAAFKDETLLMSGQGLCPPQVLALHDRLNTVLYAKEGYDTVALWKHYWRGYARHVRVPIVYNIGDRDCYIVATWEAVHEFAAAFEKSPRVDRDLLAQAPHCLELSWYSQAWYARCCGFAVECAVAHVLAGEEKPISSSL